MKDSAATVEPRKKVCWEKGADVSVSHVRKSGMSAQYHERTYFLRILQVQLGSDTERTAPWSDSAPHLARWECGDSRAKSEGG